MFLCATYLAERTEPLLEVRALQSNMLINQVTQDGVTMQKPGLQEAMDMAKWTAEEGRR